VTILSPKNVRFELRDPNFVCEEGIFTMVPTWVLVGSPKATCNTNNQKIGPHIKKKFKKHHTSKTSKVGREEEIH
jgi:hypothetical protein